MIYQVTNGAINADFVSLLKGLVSDPNDKKNKHPIYDITVDHAEEMSVHLYGKKPVKLLNLVRPREEEETKQYRLQAYQPTTKATAEKALAVVSKIFNPTLFSIQWKDQTSSGKELEKYTLQEYPIYNSVIHFLQQTALKKMIADPNGVMAICLQENLIAPNQRPEAIIKLFGSQHIWYYDQDMYLIFTKKIDGTMNGISPRGLLYYFSYFDRNSFVELEIENVGGNEINITELSRYDHNLDELPVWHLGGVPETLDDGNIVYKSFFDAAVPFWNLAISHESDLFGAYINHLHPIRAELADECDYINDKRQKCIHGWIVDRESGDKTICPSCGGTGLKSVKSPYGVYRYNRDKLDQEGSTSLSPVEYITVPIEPTAMLERRVESLREMGLYALNMDVLNDIGANQSGIAKVIDKDELYDYMYRISVIMFDVHLTNIFYFFNLLMFAIGDRSSGNNAEKNLPDIQKPVKFDISSAIELINELKTAKDASVNPQFMREKQKTINDKEFASNPDTRDKLNLMLDLDPCPELNVDEINSYVMNRLISKEYAVIHANIQTFLDRALEENPKFKDLKKKEQLDILVEYAQEQIDANKIQLNTAAIDSQSTQQQSGRNNQFGNGQPPIQNNTNPNNPIQQPAQQTQGA